MTKLLTYQCPLSVRPLRTPSPYGLTGILAGWRRYEIMGMNGDGTPIESDTETVLTASDEDF